MRTIVFIDTYKSGSSREAIQAAEALGLFTVLLTDQKSFVKKRTEFPDVHLMALLDIADRDAIRKALRSLEEQGKTIEGIVSFIDSYVYAAARLADERDLNRISKKAVKIMEDKILTREALADTPYSPYHSIYEPSSPLAAFIKEQKKRLPLIVKSPTSCGSKDVRLAKTKEDLAVHMEKLLRKFPDQPVLVEEYLEGPQYLVEVIVHEKNVQIVAVLEQEIKKWKRFIVIGYALLAQVPAEIMDSLLEAVTQIVTTMEMENGACHLELRLVDGQWKLIEINPRISGGAMNKMIQAAYGINLVEETLKLHLGETPNLERKHEKFVYTQYLTVSSSGYLVKVTGKNKANSHPGVHEVYIKPRKGAYLTVPRSMGHRYAYVMATSDDSIEEARNAAKAAASKIKFHLSNERDK